MPAFPSNAHLREIRIEEKKETSPGLYGKYKVLRHFYEESRKCDYKEVEMMLFHTRLSEETSSWLAVPRRTQGESELNYFQRVQYHISKESFRLGSEILA